MRILITGHMGYIGPVMVREFKRAGHFGAGLDSGFFRECLTSEDEIRPDREVIKDIRHVQTDDITGFDCIVHLAALSNDPLGEFAPELTLQINYEASVRTAQLAKAAGVGRFIFASSCSLYGAADTWQVLAEDAPLNPVSAYAVSKVRAEAALRELADESFTPVYMRNATAYGVSPRLRCDLVLNNLMGWAKTAARIRVMSDGTPWRPLVHIEDISRAALCAAEAPRAAVHNEAFNVGSDDGNYCVREIAEAVAQKVPGSTLEIRGETTGDLRSYRVNFQKVQKRLGFRTRWTLESGAEELAEWFDRRTETVEGFQSRRYVRLKELKHLIGEKRLSETLFWNEPLSFN